MKLSTKFTLIFSAIIILMGAISFHGISQSQHYSLEQNTTEKLEIAAESRLKQLDIRLYESLNDLDVLSANPAFLAKSPITGGVKRELGIFLTNNPQYISVSLFDMNRVQIATAGLSGITDPKYSSSEYFCHMLAGQNHIINIAMSESLQVPVIRLIVRVTDRRGKPVGALVASAKMSEFIGLMGEIIVGQDTMKFKEDILGGDGTVLYSNHYKQAILERKEENFGFIRSLLGSGKSVYSLPHVHLQDRNEEIETLLVFAKEPGYRSFKGSGWILRIEHDSNNAYVPVNGAGMRIFIFLLCVSLLGIFAILHALSITVVRPIEKLNGAASLLGQGELNTRVTIGAMDEIGKLGRAFNEMASNLKFAREQLAHAADTALARANLAEHKIIEISEETQQQIGRELHDDLGQQLTGIAYMAEVLHQQLQGQNHPAAENAAKITGLLGNAISKTNELAHGLHPVEMKESGLRAMLMRLANNTESIYGKKCEFIYQGEPKIESPLTNTNLFRITQEAIHNAVKHSEATKITLRMISAPDSLTIEVADNGRGIGDAAVLQNKGGLGMHTLHYRASLLNATLDIAGQAEGGTRVTLIMPARTPSA